jgi:hypothetical protein
MPKTIVAAPLEISSLTSPLLGRIVLLLVLAFFALTNLPWTLDEYDQAKQAYTSF